jgi:poly-gamma-glutamate synthesis protein (capsule biosynthesis protein)
MSQELPKDTLSLIFTGDIMSHGPQIKSAYRSDIKTYDYSENFRYVKPVFAQADFVIANLETTLGIKPYSGYPQFSAPPALAQACKDAGINVLATANNHSCDKSKRGILSTINILDTLNILHFGTYKNVPDKTKYHPLIIDKNNIKIALLNYTYGTNGLPVLPPVKVNLINKKEIKKDIESAKKAQPDLIIVFLHWGSQYQNHPNQQQKKLVDFLNKEGVDLVIGSHPHVIQDIDYQQDYILKKDLLTVYSLGNFISNQRTYPRDGSMIVRLKFTKNQAGKIRLSGFEAIPVWVYKFKKDNKNHYEILPIEDFKLRPGYFQSNKDYQKMMQYYKHFLSYHFDEISKIVKGVK